MGVGIALVDNPHGVAWSPFQENLLAVSTSNRPGHTPISGILYLLEFLPQNQVEIEHQIELNVGLHQVVWSHRDNSTLLCSCDDYTLRFFDLNNAECMFKEWYMAPPENGESVRASRALDWDPISHEYVLCAGIDQNINLFHTLQQEDTPLYQLDHNQNLAQDTQVLDAQFSTHAPHEILSCDRSGHVYLWDIRASTDTYQQRYRIHQRTCAMSLDQNRFDEHSIAVGNFDSSIMTYDLRNMHMPKSITNQAHYSLINQVQWSPHTQHLLASCSTDRTLRIWDMRDSNRQNEPANDLSKSLPLDSVDPRRSYGANVSSFKSQKMEDWVNAFDWNVHEVGLMAFCCNDQLVKAYNIRED